jgi:hypothetical protein
MSYIKKLIYLCIINIFLLLCNYIIQMTRLSITLVKDDNLQIFNVKRL